MREGREDRRESRNGAGIKTGLRRFQKRDSGVRRCIDMYECFHCGCRSVIWDCDFSYEDYGYDGDGIVQECHCENCGARITYMIPFGDEDDE